jgi:hypothetical protein
MNAIRAMDAASPNRAPQVSASTGSGVAESGHPFAAVMRSAVTPPQTPQKASDPSGASGASRLQFSWSNITAAKNSKRAEQLKSASSSETPNANPATSASNQDGQNADPLGTDASSSLASDRLASSLVDGHAQTSIPIISIEDGSSGITPQRVRTPPAQTGSSPSDTRRKQTSPAKDANGTAATSGSSTVATTVSLTVASVAVIVPNIPVVKLTGTAPTDPSATTASTSGTQPTDGHIVAKDASFSSPAAAPGPAVRIAQPGGGAAATGIVPNEAGIPIHGVVDAQHSATAHGAQMIDEKRGTTSSPATAVNTAATSAPNQNGGPDGSTGTQPASVGGGTSAHGLTNAISTSSADANTSNAPIATDPGNSGDAGTDPVRSGDRAATFSHGSDGSKSSSLTTEIPTVATAAKDLPGPHTNLGDSGVGLQNGSSVFSSVSHFSATGSLPSSVGGSTAARATTSDAFTALDSAAAGERGVLLHAAPHQVAVGVSDPSLGWVEVRAERVSGQIAAALTTNSAASHAALTSVLPTMATYLQEHQAGVHQVHVETSLAGGQAGTGSQGQASSQNQARTAPDSLTVANAPTSFWDAGPVGSAAVTAGQRNNFIHEGHFSIRA